VRGKIGSVKSQMRTRSEVVVTYRRINELKLNPRNPRLHSRRQIREIAASIEAFGFNVPVLIDPGGNVIAGHGRILAAQQLGWSEVATIRIAHLNETQLRAFTIADNRLSETSIWDERVLAEQLKELSALDLNFNLEAIGFTMGEIDLRIEGLSTPPENAADPGDALPAVPSKPLATRLGDIWLLGRHRVGCGSALEDSAYAALMQDELATMIFADPPFNVPVEGHVSGLGSIHHREFVMAAGEMDEAQFIHFLTQAFSLLARHSSEGSLHFICMDWRHLAELLAAGRVAYTKLKNLCVWVKSNGGMGSLYRSQHELVGVFKHGRGPHRNNVQLGEYGRNRTNVWNYPNVSAFGRAGEEAICSRYTLRSNRSR
jgi:hypothetical protein